MEFTSETTERGVRERGFTLTVAGERVPGILWEPEVAGGPRPLLLIGHGGTQEKRTDSVLARARTFVRHHGYVVVALDAPGHGDRVTPDQTERARAALVQRIERRAQEYSDEQRREALARTQQAVPEWQATLDAVTTLEYVNADAVGYWGVSMGTAIGAPLLAAEPRVKAAVLGLNGLRPGMTEFEQAARSITIPLLFVFQWNDQLVSQEAGIALFDAFGSREKTMHINLGGHVEIPPFERESYERFFLRHLGSGAA